MQDIVDTIATDNIPTSKFKVTQLSTRKQHTLPVNGHKKYYVSILTPVGNSLEPYYILDYILT